MHRTPFLFFFLSLALLCGCSETPVDSKPSYSELVVTYNAELAALDRLESKKEKLAAEFEKALKAVQPKPKSGGDSLAPTELLEKAKAMLSDGEIDPGADPNALLDQLVERGENTGELADQILGLLGEKPAAGDDAVEAAAKPPTEEELAAIASVKEEFEPQIAKIDSEIQEQVSRVERARKARDEAESSE